MDPVTYHRALDRLCCVIPNLSLVIVTPGEDVARCGAHHTVQRAAGYVNHPLASQGSHDTLGGSLVAVITMSQTVVVALTPGGGEESVSAAATMLLAHHTTQSSWCLPCVDMPVSGDGNGELGPAQYSSHSLP